VLKLASFILLAVITRDSLLCTATASRAQQAPPDITSTVMLATRARGGNTRLFMKFISLQLPGFEWRWCRRPSTASPSVCDYLRRPRLGAIWITPMYPSPLVDFWNTMFRINRHRSLYGTLAISIV